MPGRSGKVWTGSEWVAFGPAGEPGKSTYEIAVEQGYTGTLEQWVSELTGPIGPAGPAGPSGPIGLSGAPGVGLPSGGTTGQVLVKNSNADYDVAWQTAYLLSDGSGGPALTGNIIVPDGAITGGLKTTWIDPTTGYTYNTHRFIGTNFVDSLFVSVGVVGQLLVVAGGGGGGGYTQSGGSSNYGAGGGAGGLFYGDYAFGAGIHNLWVGTGGAGGAGAGVFGNSQSGFSGGFSWFDHDIVNGTGGVKVLGGGGGAGTHWNAPGAQGGSGGSGGGSTGPSSGLGGQGTAGQGNNGAPGSNRQGGGGGGAMTAGSGATGGTGRTLNITGSSVVYAQGGNGGGNNVGTANTGNGGGGAATAGSSPNNGKAGADGVIIVRYRIA